VNDEVAIALLVEDIRAARSNRHSGNQLLVLGK
jgi:hypothetical protein